MDSFSPPPMPVLSISSFDTIAKCASFPLRDADVFIYLFLPKIGNHHLDAAYCPFSAITPNEKHITIRYTKLYSRVGLGSLFRNWCPLVPQLYNNNNNNNNNKRTCHSSTTTTRPTGNSSLEHSFAIRHATKWCSEIYPSGSKSLPWMPAMRQFLFITSHGSHQVQGGFEGSFVRRLFTTSG
jgi:hypothetical protein